MRYEVWHTVDSSNSRIEAKRGTCGFRTNDEQAAMDEARELGGGYVIDSLDGSEFHPLLGWLTAAEMTAARNHDATLGA